MSQTQVQPRKHFATAEVTGRVVAVRTDQARGVVRVDVDFGHGNIVTVSFWRNPAAAGIPQGAILRAWGRMSQWGDPSAPRTGIDITASPNHGYSLLASPADPRAGWAIRGTLENVQHDGTVAVTTILPAATRDGVTYPERKNTYLIRVPDIAIPVLRECCGEDVEMYGTFEISTASNGYGRVTRTVTPIMTRSTVPDIEIPVNGPSVTQPSPVAMEARTAVRPAQEARSGLPF